MRRKIFGAIVALAMVAVLIWSATSMGDFGWNEYVAPTIIPVGMEGGILSPISLNYQVYEVMGPIMMCLGIVMFGAIIAGVAISKEDDEEEGEQ